MSQNIQEFLKTRGLSPDNYNFEADIDRFHAAMEEGLSKENADVDMLPTFVGVPDEIKPDCKVLVIDLGGTNLRVGWVAFDEERKAEILGVKKQKVPGTSCSVKKEAVFDLIAELSAEWVSECEFVGFCFSFPFEILDNGDSKVLFFGKELDVDGMVGCLLNENMRAAWSRIGVEVDAPITILNDTVSTLLMGKLRYPSRRVSSYIGFILGTGMNISYVEAHENITKKPNLTSGASQIINTECGDFSGFALSEIDEVYDKSSRNPGRYYAEKMVSGAYIGALTQITLGMLSEQGLCKTVEAEKISTKHVNDFMLDLPDVDNPLNIHCGKHPEDRKTLFEVIDVILERAAKVVAILLVGTVLKTPPLNSLEAPVVFSIDGSSYGGDYFYRERIEAYLFEELTRKRDIRFQIIRPENASLLGASVAAMGSLL